MTTLVSALERARSSAARAAEVLAAPTNVSGRVYCEGPSEDGETIQTFIPVSFPAELTSEPTIQLTAVMDLSAVVDEVPEIYMVVTELSTVRRGVSNHYDGMTIGVKITGNRNNDFIIHWVAEATGIVGAIPNWTGDSAGVVGATAPVIRAASNG